MVLTKKGLTNRLNKWLDAYRFYICKGSDFKKSTDTITVLICKILDTLKGKNSIEDLYKSTYNADGSNLLAEKLENYNNLEDFKDVLKK